MNFFQRRKLLKATDTMDLIPIRAIGHEDLGNLVVLVVPKFELLIIHWFYPPTKQMFYRVKLDQIGSLTWNCIDGDKSVQMIADHIRNKHSMENESLDDLEERLGKFMTMLYENRYISFRQFMEN
jgi:hypothetical protein